MARELTSRQHAALFVAYEALKQVANFDDRDDDDAYCLICRSVDCIPHDPECPVGRAILATARKLFGLSGGVDAHDVCDDRTPSPIPGQLPDGYRPRIVARKF